MIWYLELGIQSILLSLLWYLIAKYYHGPEVFRRMMEFFTNAGEAENPEAIVLTAAMSAVSKHIMKEIGPKITNQLNLWLARELKGVDMNAEMTEEELAEHAGSVISRIQPGAMPLMGKLLGKRAGKVNDLLELAQGLQQFQTMQGGAPRSQGGLAGNGGSYPPTGGY